MLVSAMLFYCKLTKALLSYSFELNPYNPCVVNKMVNSKQLTVCQHVVTEFRQPIQVQSRLEMPGILVQLGHIQRT